MTFQRMVLLLPILPLLTIMSLIPLACSAVGGFGGFGRHKSQHESTSKHTHPNEEDSLTLFLDRTYLDDDDRNNKARKYYTKTTLNRSLKAMEEDEIISKYLIIHPPSPLYQLRHSLRNGWKRLVGGVRRLCGLNKTGLDSENEKGRKGISRLCDGEWNQWWQLQMILDIHRLLVIRYNITMPRIQKSSQLKLSHVHPKVWDLRFQSSITAYSVAFIQITWIGISQTCTSHIGSSKSNSNNAVKNIALELFVTFLFPSRSHRTSTSLYNHRQGKTNLSIFEEVTSNVIICEQMSEW